ncbi:hypothetical protein P355_5414 [Burkholderia cenocepacia KC-01]|nr:hypothetical protein P355_5414 [Burkholderia cenocepacia KC-01]
MWGGRGATPARIEEGPRPARRDRWQGIRPRYRTLPPEAN